MTKHMSPIRKVQRELCGMLLGDAPTTLRQFFLFVEGSARSNEFNGIVRHILVSLSSSVWYRLDLQFSKYPFVLLEAVGAKATSVTTRDIMETFAKADTCCLDECFSERLLQWAAKVAEDKDQDAVDALCSDVVISCLSALADHSKLSVGHVERLHAVMKHLIGRSTTKRPTAESVLLLGHLRRLMKSCMQNGNLDFSLEKNPASFAKQQGLVTCSDASRARREGRAKRLGGNFQRQNFLSTKSRIAKQLRGGKSWSQAEETQARQAWSQEFDSTSEIARTEYINTYSQAIDELDPSGGASPSQVQAGSSGPVEFDLLDIMAGEVTLADVDGALQAETARHHHLAPLDSSDSVWPLAVEKFLDYLGGRGVTSCAKDFRADLRKYLVVDDVADSPVPDGPIGVRLPCHAVHPGLCLTKHKPFYNDAIKVAAALRSFVKDIAAGTPLKVECLRAGSDDPQVIWLCMGTVRQRDPAVGVFAECAPHPEVAQGVELKYTGDEGEEEFSFASCYAVAVQCLSQGNVNSIRCFQLQCFNATPYCWLAGPTSKIVKEAVLFADDADAVSKISEPASSSTDGVGLMDFLDSALRPRQERAARREGPVRHIPLGRATSAKKRSASSMPGPSAPAKQSEHLCELCEDVKSDDSISDGLEEMDLAGGEELAEPAEGAASAGASQPPKRRRGAARAARAAAHPPTWAAKAD